MWQTVQFAEDDAWTNPGLGLESQAQSDEDGVASIMPSLVASFPEVERLPDTGQT